MLIARTSWAAAFVACILATFVPSLFAGSNDTNLVHNLVAVSWAGAIGMLALAFAAMVSFLYSFTQP